LARRSPKGVHISDELIAEQQYIDHAYECLERARTLANRLTSMVEVGEGGTEQARYERDVIQGQILSRLTRLNLGDVSLIFGRIDHDNDSGGDSFHIGRLGVWDEDQDPVVVDWRAPASEPFYRATGTEPFGLKRRRHFTTRGHTLVDIDDDFFGDLRGLDNGTLRGHGALMTALEGARSGRLGDVVGTIQAEQDAIIRSPQAGILVVQGGPGTGKTVVALHRAAYLLYTHRFPLEGQGVLVAGPNRLFLAYIEQVLPSLGEAGVEMSTVSDLVADVRVDGLDHEDVARIKGDSRNEIQPITRR
jgi:DNA helicase IV